MNYIDKTAIVENATIGEGARIGAFCLIGAPPEKIGVFPESPFGVEVGENSVLHGHNTIDCGVKRPTKIGKGCWLMKGVHIGHCAQIGDGTIIAPHAVIGGGVTIGERCNIGIGAIFHPNVEVPKGCMIGAGCVVTKTTKMQPFCVYVGNPARFLKWNQKAIDLAGLTPEQVTAIQNDWINRSE